MKNSRVLLICVVLVGVVLLSGCTTTSSGKIKAGFIYVGPIGDYGWTNAHDEGRTIVEDKYDWLETVYIESVAEDTASVVAAADTLVEVEQCDVIFTTSFGFMDGTLAAAEKYPDVLFFHCSGFMRGANVGNYFADFYQLYYLNGLMAGALSQSGELGYVGAFPIPEVIRHINAFTLGARAVNATATVDVRWIYSWYDPTLATNAADALVAAGVDMLAFTEDSPAVIQAAEKYDDVYAFSHYSPMQYYGNDSTISGQLVHWDILYDEILSKVNDGTYNNTNLADVDYLWFLKEDAVELGGLFGVPINTIFEDDLKAVDVSGETAYALVMRRLDEMDGPTVTFDPFTGPIKAQNGTIMFADGVQATIPDLFAFMDWFVEGVIGSPS
ncbi:BMP family ABC transporter substrate-binding protein [Candidatus Heimdallarchaeota archaeon B3_Heim]|nr:MAG: BMP family ABC transporter substrate-binding protein [Candidatus Heimdallarchaeota archaeon B3_Heim]